MKRVPITFLLFALAATGCVTKSPRFVSVPPSKSADVSQPPLRIPEPIRHWTLKPEATSTPAVLKGKKQDIVSGEYSFASFQDLLRLIGRVEGVKHEVLQIRFFEHIAAAVTLEGKTFKCVVSPGGEWQIVGVSYYTDCVFPISRPQP